MMSRSLTAVSIVFQLFSIVTVMMSQIHQSITKVGTRPQVTGENLRVERQTKGIPIKMDEKIRERQRSAIQLCVNLGKSRQETLADIKKAYGDRAMSRQQYMNGLTDSNRGKNQSRMMLDQADQLSGKMASKQFSKIGYTSTENELHVAENTLRAFLRSQHMLGDNAG